MSRLAAALSCYTILSIAPLGVLAVSVIGAVFGQDIARHQLAIQLGSVFGESAAQAIEAIISNAHAPGKGLSSTIMGLAVLLVGASAVFVELQAALNEIWRVPSRTGSSVATFIRHRFFSFAMVLSVAFLLLVSLFLSAALAAMGKFFASDLPGGEAVWQVLTAILSLVLAAVLFALIFKVVPETNISWDDVWLAAVATAVLFTIGKSLLAIYLGKSSVTSSYGAAGSLVALVIWVYYSSQIVLFGAELAEVNSRYRSQQQGKSGTRRAAQARMNNSNV